MRSRGVFQFAVVAQPLLDENLLFGEETDLFGAAAGIADGQDPDEVAGAFGANSAARAVTDAAVEQGAAEDLGSGREGGSELGACPAISPILGPAFASERPSGFRKYRKLSRNSSPPDCS